MKKILTPLILLVFLSACVPTKDLIYLQEKDSENGQSVKEVAFKPYRVQVGDQLRIEVKSNLEEDPLAPLFQKGGQTQSGGASFQETGLYFSSYVVDDHGNIRMPLLEEMNVLGYTADEVRSKIEKELKENHYKETVNLFVEVKLAGFRFSVNGEVGRTGTHTLFQDRVTIMEAIATAGDITLVGDRKNVNIIRRYPHGSEIHTLDLTDKKTMDSPYYYIQPNDYIYVQPLPQKSWGTGTTAAQTLATVVAGLSLIMTTIVLLRTL